MRILLDECLPVQLRHLFTKHEAFTVSSMQWRSLKNGDLLEAAEREGFDIFMTADAGAADHYRGRLAIVVVPTNRRKVLDGMVDAIRGAVDGIRPGERRRIPLPGSRDERSR